MRRGKRPLGQSQIVILGVVDIGDPVPESGLCLAVRLSDEVGRL